MIKDEKIDIYTSYCRIDFPFRIWIFTRKKWTLSECIDYAVTHNIEVKQSDNQIQNLKVEKNTLRNRFLPNLNAGASQDFTFGCSLNQNNTYENSHRQNILTY